MTYPAHLPLVDMFEHCEVEPATGQVRLNALRKAIQANQVSFPAQVPVFACQHRADIQWRLVQLYFVHGWSCSRLSERYRVTDRRIQQLLQRWVMRAKAVGYLQEIPLEHASAAEVVEVWQDVVPDFTPEPAWQPEEMLVFAAK